MEKLIAPQLMALQKESMKAKNKLRTTTLRAIGAAFKQILVDERLSELSATQELTVIKKMVKQRNDSFTQYTEAGREDLALVEKEELAILEEFLPPQMSDEEILAEIKKVLATFDEKPTMQKMGMIMGQLSALKAKADMGKVGQMVKELIK